MFRVKRPFAVCALAMLITSTTLLTLGNDIFLFFFISSSVICAVLTLKHSPYSRYALLFTAAMVLSSVITSYSYGTVLAEHSLSGKGRYIEGALYSTSAPDETGYSNIILTDCSVDGVNISGKINADLSLYDTATPGDIVSFQADFIYPNTSEGIFSVHTMSEKISLFATSSEKAEIIGCRKDFALYAAILKIREYTKNKISDFLPEDSAAVATALITGDKSSLSARTNTDLRISGVSHIFAVSGMHLSLWSAVFFILFKQRSKSSFLPNVAASLFVIFYCIFTGLSPSVLRAGIMLLCVFSARLIKRHADPQNSLGIAVTVLLIFNPFLSGNVSFLLSAAATFALVSFVPGIFDKHGVTSKKLRFIKQKLKSVPDNLLISLSVILITLPICSVFFGYISLLSPFSSLVMTPLAELLMITSGVAILLPVGNPISAGLFSLSQFFGDLIIKCAAFFANFSVAVLPADKNMVLPWFAASATAVIIASCLRKNKKQILVTVLTCTLILNSLNSYIFFRHKDETTLFIPKGENATCISIVGNSGVKSAVFGCGGSYNYAMENISYLNSKGILRTDLIIVPRNKTTENDNEERMINSLQPESVIRMMPQNTTGAVFSGTLWDDVHINSKTTPDFSVSKLTIDSVEIIICTLPFSDFYTADEAFREADILICRSSIPKSIDTDNFSDIIVITERELPALPSNALTTKDTDIEITVKGDTYVINR